MGHAYRRPADEGAGTPVNMIGDAEERQKSGIVYANRCEPGATSRRVGIQRIGRARRLRLSRSLRDGRAPDTGFQLQLDGADVDA